MDLLKKQLLESHLILPEEFYSGCAQYADTLLAWNKVHNLSGAENMDELRSHLFDSLYPLTFLGDFDTCLDIGSGAGLPAMVLAIAKQTAHFTLVEPLQKRASFLRFVASILKLENITIENSRIEQVTPKTYDLITSRAVSDAKTVYDMAYGFMDDESVLLLYKGKNTEKEADLIDAKVIRSDYSSYILARRS